MKRKKKNKASLKLVARPTAWARVIKKTTIVSLTKHYIIRAALQDTYPISVRRYMQLMQNVTLILNVILLANQAKLKYMDSKQESKV